MTDKIDLLRFIEQNKINCIIETLTENIRDTSIFSIYKNKIVELQINILFYLKTETDTNEDYIKFKLIQKIKNEDF
jgi:hypothetical protein